MSRSADDSDTFRTLVAPAGASILVSGSKFISHLAPAASGAAGDAELTLRQRRYPDATHHCWASRLGRPGTLVERQSDAGEPSGTAGRPILDSLRRAGLENAICIVSRYFGGTKLGAGGLARAYADATAEAIAAAAVVIRTIVLPLVIDFDHEQTGVVYGVFNGLGLDLNATGYDSLAHGTAHVPRSQVETVRARLCERAGNNVSVQFGEPEIR